jgi:glucose/arabinose dehydrogenase
MRTTSLRPMVALISCVAVAACSSKGGAPARQYGPDPYLPEPRQYLLPPMSVPKAIGWKANEVPKVSAGLKVEALATGLEHPRTLYTLPNGDILVVESNSPGTQPSLPARATPPAWPSSRRRISCSPSSTSGTRSVPTSSPII